MELLDLLKEFVDEDTLGKVNAKIADGKYKYADLSEGGYIDKNKHDALKTQFDTLTNKVKEFDGVDVEALKASAANWEQKYNDDLSKIKLDYAVDAALQDAKNKRAVKSLLDMSIVKLDGDNVVGISEQIAKLKDSDPYLFSDMQQAGKNKGFKHGKTDDDDSMLDAKIAQAMGIKIKK